MCFKNLDGHTFVLQIEIVAIIIKKEEEDPVCRMMNNICSELFL